MDRLSIVIATYNEEKNIKRCLESVKGLSGKIIIIDGDSQDRTVAIAKQYTPLVFVVKNNPMFHSNKQLGVDKVRSEWTLQLDADEVITDELKGEIEKAIKIDSDIVGYYIPRKNNFLGKFMMKGGMYPDFVIRLFQTKKGSFPQKSVHEQIKIDGNCGYLKNPILHYPYDSVNDYLIKANRYTSLTSLELKKEGIRVTPISTIKYCLLIPFKTFVSIYIRHRGFMDGFNGFVWAFLSSTHYFLAYGKLINTK